MKLVKLIALFLALGILFFLPKIVWAEQIDNYQVNIVVNPDSSIGVEEIINYDFGVEQRHGIYRDIPYKYQARGGNYKLEIDNIAVTDEMGRAINFGTSQSGGSLQIKIGDADIYVTGKKTYVIKYKVSGAINYFNDHDELYWNVTGNDWAVNILKVQTNVSLNRLQSGTQQISGVCYAGVIGATENCEGKILGDNSAQFSEKSLTSGEGLTVVVGWPKGFTKEPGFLDKVIKRLKDNGVVLMPILVLIFLFWYWKKYGKDPAGRGTIIAEYEPPVGILPGEAGVVYDEKYQTKDLTATIIDLARKGYLRIEEIKKDFLGIKTGKDWKITKIKEWDGERNFEYSVYNSFLQNEVVISKLRSDVTFAKKAKEVKKEIYEAVRSKAWFTRDPEKQRATFVAIGWLFLGLLYFLGGIVLDFGGGIAIGSLVVSGVLFLVFSGMMPKRTQEGVLMKEKLEGFKLFLSVTEKDRVSFHFSPSAHPEKFAEYLPWAIIFGVEKEWAKVFEGIDLPQPDWYVGTWVGNYTALALADSMGSFNNSFSKTAVGSAAAGGRSGLGGGGFSGGGFGGGGGGSW